MDLLKKIARRILRKELSEQVTTIMRQNKMLEDLHRQTTYLINANHSMKHLCDSMQQRLRNRLH